MSWPEPESFGHSNHYMIRSGLSSLLCSQSYSLLVSLPTRDMINLRGMVEVSRIVGRKVYFCEAMQYFSPNRAVKAQDAKDKAVQDDAK